MARIDQLLEEYEEAVADRAGRVEDLRREPA
jgi:hypothetical protein